ncbi:MAG: invasion associated locus B family protein [Pseudomonadota bacterium]
MTNALRISAILLLAFAFPLPALAQDATEETPAESTAAQQDAAPAEEAPAEDAPAETVEGEDAAPAEDNAPATAEGAPAQPQEQQPQELLRETHGDWQVRCDPQDLERCFMVQIASAADGNAGAEFSLIRLPDGQDADAGATIVVPLGVLLPAGLRMQIDGGQQRTLPFSWCVRSGCFVRLGLDGATITQMKRGAQARLTVVAVPRPDAGIELTLSLAGFTAAYDSLQPVAAPQ